MSHFEWKDETLHLRLRVVPRASRNAILELLDQRLKVTVMAPPVDGEANAHLIRWYSKLCNVSKANVEVVSGHNARNKTISILRPKQIPAEFLVDGPQRQP